MRYLLSCSKWQCCLHNVTERNDNYNIVITKTDNSNREFKHAQNVFLNNWISRNRLLYTFYVFLWRNSNIGLKHVI